MVAVPFPVTSAPGARPQESAGRLINAYAVKTEQGARGPLKWLRAPGLRELADGGGHAGYRGFIEINGNVLAALEDRAVLIAKSGSVTSVTDLGALDGAQLITIAKNNAAPVADIVAVTEEGAFNLYTDDVPDNFADADLPQPNSVSGVKGYFAFTIADGRLFASNLNSVNLNSLAFTTAPGRLLRGVSYRDEWFVFGDNFCQVYRDAGLSPFPFDLVATIPIGLAGTHAIAGWEPGFTGTMAWAAQDDIVYKLNGYTPQPVSTEDVSRDIAATPDKSVLEASVYMSNGNAFWVLTRPGVLELDAQPHHRHLGRARLLRPGELARVAHREGLFHLARGRPRQRNPVRDRRGCVSRGRRPAGVRGRVGRGVLVAQSPRRRTARRRHGRGGRTRGR